MRTSLNACLIEQFFLLSSITCSHLQSNPSIPFQPPLTLTPPHNQVSPQTVNSEFSFRQPRSFPGGGLYERFDHVRLVLQLHDELIYEVRTADLESVSFTSFDFIMFHAFLILDLCALIVKVIPACFTYIACTVYCILYCTVLYCAIIYCTVQYCAIIYCTVLYCDVMWCNILCCTVLYCTVMWCDVMHYAIFWCMTFSFRSQPWWSSAWKVLSTCVCLSRWRWSQDPHGAPLQTIPSLSLAPSTALCPSLPPALVICLRQIIGGNQVLFRPGLTHR